MKELTKIDAGVAAAVILLLALVLGCQTHIGRARREAGECIMNLRNLGAGYSSFVLEKGHGITEVSTNSGGTKEYVGHPESTYMHFRAIVSSYLTSPSTNVYVTGLICPLDSRVPAPLGTLQNSNISYFLSVNAPVDNPQWILSGNRNISFTRAARSGPSARRQVSWDARQGLHGEAGYILFLDASVTRVDTVGLDKFFNQSGNENNQIKTP